MNRNVFHQALGLIDYKKAWDYQQNLFNQTIRQKIDNRDIPQEAQKVTPNYILTCEHPHVYTLGKSGKEHNLIWNEAILKEKNVVYYKIDRGGDITYHGPGQLVCYPILDLDHFFTDIKKYLRYLEETVIKTLADYGLQAGRLDGMTGVWLDPEKPQARKICAMGVRTSRWVTMHGIALNINTDLSYFDGIVPCGINGKGVTSLEKELSQVVDMQEVEAVWLRHFKAIFEAAVIGSRDAVI